jgi:hypothetical protein
MQRLLITAIVIAQLFAASVPAFACPVGYARCGTHYCCPQ